MKAKLTQYILFSAILASWLLALGGCSTAEVSPLPPMAAAPPPYVQVPHPMGYDIGDLRAIFMNHSAPKTDEIKDCDADLKKLTTLTQSEEEVAAGARELVKNDPVKYHWCYYGKILELENYLKSEAFVDERQKNVLQTYGFLTPIGRAFMQEFHDSRYLRWGVRHYRQISEWIFYRKLEPTQQSTVDLVEASNPFGLLREPMSPMPVLDKYGILGHEPPTAPLPAIKSEVAVPAPEPIAAASPVPAPDPAANASDRAPASVTSSSPAAAIPSAPVEAIMQGDSFTPTK